MKKILELELLKEILKLYLTMKVTDPAGPVIHF